MAILLVLFSHAGWDHISAFIPNAGHLGVMLFFTLSGFVMCYHYLPGQPSLRYWSAFLLRRFFRIYPLLIILMLAGWLAFTLWHFPIFRSYSPVNIGQQLLLVRPIAVPMWTIFVEMKFYFLFALLGPVMSLCQGTLRMGILIAAWIGLLWFQPHDMLLDLWPHLSFFLGGMIAAMLYTKLETSWMLHHPLWDMSALTGPLMILLAIFPRRFAALFGFSHHLWTDAWFFSPLMATTVLAVACSRYIRHIFSESSPLYYTGIISYSLYLTNCTSWFGANYLPFGGYARLIVTFGLAYIVAWDTYEVIEKPFHRLGKQLTHRFLESPPPCQTQHRQFMRLNNIIANLRSKEVIQSVERYQT